MVITRVMYYKCNAPPRTYHYITLRDKVHLAHLWCEDHTIAHLWGYSPPLGPNQQFLLCLYKNGTTRNYAGCHLANRAGEDTGTPRFVRIRLF